MKTRTLAISILLLAIVLTPLAMGAKEGEKGGPRGPQASPRQGRGGGPDMGGMGMFGGQGDITRMLMGRFGERLGLTEEQKTAIKEIADANKEKAAEAGKAVREAIQGLNKAANEGEKADIEAAGKAVGDAFTKQALQRAATTKAVKGVLTEEQQAKLEELKTEMKDRMQQRMQQGADGARGGKRGQGGKGGGRRSPKEPDQPQD
ncbi:MAG: Spy/CpxP family protein refolding chaperone [Phycisphaerae bacterium]|nr:Spy/CpxP family protein refolding chaperone [Phycisphaerae bacterium]